MGRMKSSSELLDFNSLERLMKKAAKGAATEITKRTAKVLQAKIRENLYANDKLVHTDSGAYRNTYGISDRALEQSVFYENVVGRDGSYTSTVDFNDTVLEGKLEDKTSYVLGRYEDRSNKAVDFDELIGEWLEEGTYSGLVPREGAKFMEETEEEINNWISDGGIDGYISKEVGGFDISVEKG